MSKYIDKETVRRIIDSERSKEQMLTMLDNVPTADIRDNKHGKWVKRFEGTIAEGIFCNQCWRSTHRRTNFCPNCGAYMREVEE